MRQAKTFTHVHFIQNRTMIMEWGPCPNSKGAAGSGDDRNADFSSLMIDDSPDIVNFQTNKCNNEKNADCAKCGAGNDINREKWEATVKHYGPKIKDIGNGGAMQVTAGSFFPPFQYFARSALGESDRIHLPRTYCTPTRPCTLGPVLGWPRAQLARSCDICARNTSTFASLMCS